MKAISLIHFTLASINAFKFIRQMSAGVMGEERAWGEKRRGRKGRKNTPRLLLALSLPGRWLGLAEIWQTPAGSVQDSLLPPGPSYGSSPLPISPSRHSSCTRYRVDWGLFWPFLCRISSCSFALSQRRLPSASASPRQAILSVPRSASL